MVFSCHEAMLGFLMFPMVLENLFCKLLVPSVQCNDTDTHEVDDDDDNASVDLSFTPSPSSRMKSLIGISPEPDSCLEYLHCLLPYIMQVYGIGALSHTNYAYPVNAATHKPRILIQMVDRGLLGWPLLL
jgi:hypothetical protein